MKITFIYSLILACSIFVGVAQPSVNQLAGYPPFEINKYAKQYYENGDYELAARTAIASLNNSKRGNVKAMKILASSLALMDSASTTKAMDLEKRAQDSVDIFKRKSLDMMDEVIDELTGLNFVRQEYKEMKSYVVVRITKYNEKCTSEDQKISVGESSIAAQLEEAERIRKELEGKVLEMYYQRAEELLGYDDRDSLLRGVFTLDTLIRINSAYKDVTIIQQQAIKEATKKVLIVPFQSAGIERSYQDIGRSYHKGLQRQLKNGTKSARFTKVLDFPYSDFNDQSLTRISRQEAIRLAQELGADEVYFGRISSVDYEIGKPTSNTQTYTRTIRKEVPVIENGVKSKKTVKEEVEADARITEQVFTTSIKGSYEVIEVATGNTLRNYDINDASSISRSYSSYMSGDRETYNKNKIGNGKIIRPSLLERKQNLIRQSCPKTSNSIMQKNSFW